FLDLVYFHSFPTRRSSDLPQFGIYGVVIAINVYVLLVTLLHGALLYKKTNYLISFYQVCKMVLLVFIPFVCSYFLKIFFAPQLRSEEHTSELQSRFDLVCR